MNDTSIIAAIISIAALSACSTPPQIAYNNPLLDTVTESELRKFESAEAFKAYLQKVEDIELEIAAERIKLDRYAQLFSPPPSAVADDTCTDDECDEVIVVTATRATSNPTITNNQKVGVDEGDIVKQIGDHLVVLQDGRLFSILIGEGVEGELEFIDRANVYRDPNVHTWYDEMLVSGRRVIVTGYSYDANASEIALFTLDENGNFILEDTFYISSNDYYSTENYATRVVNGKFVFHTPIYLSWYSADDALPWPLLRHWNGAFYASHYNNWDELPTNTLLQPEDIYRPVQGTTSPLVHVVTICDVGNHKSGERLECKSSGFVAPEGYQYYVSEDDVFLWTWPNSDDWEVDSSTTAYCENRGRAPRSEVLPAIIYKIPINGEAPSILRVYGRPFDQFSIDTRGNKFRALIDWTDPRCASDLDTYHPTLFKSSLRQFSDSIGQRSYGAYQPFSSFSGDYELENRFTHTHLIYSLDDWGRYPPDIGEKPNKGLVIVSEVKRPQSSQTISLPHNVARLEVVGENAIATGYKDHKGLQLSYISTADDPVMKSTLSLSSRYESEGRSHAFNYIVENEGNAILGLPTVYKKEEGGRWWWRSDSSDISFLHLADGQLHDLGAILANDDALDESYKCEISCIDWYGNTRPIFTEGRIFGLSGVELVEGIIENGRIHEQRRVNLSSPLTLDTVQ